MQGANTKWTEMSTERDCRVRTLFWRGRAAFGWDVGIQTQ